MNTIKPKDRDFEKTYTTAQYVEKLRRLADCLEQGNRFEIQIGGEHLAIPNNAIYNIEHERNGVYNEIEFQIKWEDQ